MLSPVLNGKRQVWYGALALLAVLPLAGCIATAPGSGGGQQQPLTVTVSPTPVSLAVGGQQTFTAVVGPSGTSQAVTWGQPTLSPNSAAPATGGLGTMSASGVYTILYEMAGGGGPRLPYSNLSLGPTGVLYGTTFAGGANDLGTVFSLTPGSGSWNVATLYSFSTTVGDRPLSGVLLLPKQGILYGTTSAKGVGGFGSVFEIDLSGTMTTLINFSGTGTGSEPTGNLLMDANGNLYGVGFEGGTSGSGVVYKITP